MKCSPHVSPLWKNPAANGPWYQVESNPVIPVPSLSLTPPAKWTTATRATSSATQVSTDPHEPLPPAGGTPSAPLPASAGADDLPPTGRGAQIQTPAATAASSTR